MAIIYLSDSLYQSLGCWKDLLNARAIDGYQGALGVHGCFEKALAKRYNVFGVQYGGECYTSATAEDTYKIHGPSTGCSNNGDGGFYAQEVYKIGQLHCFNQPHSIFKINTSIVEKTAYSITKLIFLQEVFLKSQRLAMNTLF